MNPIVSIITPNYNASKFIRNSLESVINQTYKNWELIIVDDCSTDDSVAIINEFNKIDKRIRFFQLDKNSGPAIARNKGIEEAKGKFIAFLDSDDRWLPTKLEKQLSFMLKNKIALSHTSYISHNEMYMDEKLLEAKQKVTYHDLLTNNYIGCLTTMYSIEHLGKVYMPIISKRQDWALWLKITRQNVISYGIDEPLALYTRRKNSVSSNKFRLMKFNWEIYRNFEKLNFFKSSYYFFILFIKKLLK